MNRFQSKHFLTGEELSRKELLDLLDLAQTLKSERDSGKLIRQDLNGKNMAMIFEKQSLRTRMSFSVAMHELGGTAIELTSSVRKKEEPEDTIQVVGRYSHLAMVRTFEHSILDRMAVKSPIPLINGLSDSHHPCQALADLQTLLQHFGPINNGKVSGLKLAYIGDGNNVLNSLLLLLPYLGVHVSYACPKGFEPSSFIVKKAKARALEGGGSITEFHDPYHAVKGVDAIYTDVWASMGQEAEEEEKEKSFEGFEVNEELYKHAHSNTIILHCMPMVRGKEISEEIANHPNCLIYSQAENRLHAQKALILGLTR